MNFTQQKIISLIIMLIMTGSIQFLKADMCYDVAQDIYFSMPESSDINPYEYDRLYSVILTIPLNTSLFYNLSSRSEIAQELTAALEYIKEYLMDIGTPEALRLLDDFKLSWKTYVDFLLTNRAELQKNKNFVIRDEHWGIKYKVCKNLNAFNKPK
jgi:hypothetical protein